MVCDAALLSPEQFAMAEHIKNESVITARGLIRLRSAETYNPSVETGEIELAADTLELLSPAQTLPISIDDRSSVRDELRLKYRFLDLRRPSMLKISVSAKASPLLLKAIFKARALSKLKLPCLQKAHRRAHAIIWCLRGCTRKLYALPQSPQLLSSCL